MAKVSLLKNDRGLQLKIEFSDEELYLEQDELSKLYNRLKRLEQNGTFQPTKEI